MKTRTTVFSLLATLILLAGIVTTAYAATQSIGGTAVAGNLRVDVYDNGAMAIGQYNGGVWQENIYGVTAKGSTLCVATTRYDMGGNSTWSPGAGGTVATWVSNTGGGAGTGAIVTTWTAGGLQIVQITSYTDGNQYYTIEWEITNLSGGAINDLRLFNGQDTLLAGSDAGNGWWNAGLGAFGSIGVTHPTNGQQMWLQPVSEAPFNYESRVYYTSRANVNACALDGTVTAGIHDNGYALEFRRATLANGATWGVTLEEHFVPSAPPNTAPVAVNDSYSIHHDTTLVVPALTGVLFNDTDAESDPLTAIKVTDPASGTLSAFGTDGSFTYVPQAGFVGDVTFTYKANDGTADSNIATVTIHVTNTVPLAVDDSYTTTMSVAFNGATVLVNDSDADLDPLTAAVVTPPAHASAFTFNADGTFTYEPENGFRGTDTFTYMANDGAQKSNVATVSIEMTPLVMTFKSISQYDGWMLESLENSNKGGTVWANQILRLGDSIRDQQYRSMLSFNASTLPDDGVIVGALVKIHHFDVQGVDPLTTHGNLIADMRKGAFGGSPTLAPSDFEALASKVNVGRFVLAPGSLKWYQLVLSPANFQYINPAYITQFRLRFVMQDDDNMTDDYVRFASGNSVKAGRPLLVIEYYIPHP